MKVLLMALALGISSCGTEEPTPSPIPPQIVDPLFAEFIRDFEGDMGIKVNSSVVIGDTEKEAYLGVCHFLPRRVVVVAASVLKMPYHLQKAIIYHELGHCDLVLEHTPPGDWTLTDPYMYTSAPGYYKNHWEYLVADMKEKKEVGPFIQFGKG